MKRLAALKELMSQVLNRGETSPVDNEVTGSAGGFGLGAILNALDWDHAREEVDRESRARIVLIGATGAGKTTLLATLRGFQLPPVESELRDAGDTMVEDLGLFVLIDVPGAGPRAAAGEGDPAWSALQNADLIVWVLDGTVGMRAWEYEWLCRIRASSKPLIVVLNKLDLQQARGEIDRLSRMLSSKVIPLSARDETNVATHLLPHMVDTCPGLATALGREVPAWRHIAAQRVTQRAVAVSGLVGVEPVPLLDIPFQVLIQLRLVLRLAAIYGEPLGDHYSRELLATIVSGAGLRYLGQQLAKVIPLVGWAVSGGLAAGGTWVIGRLATEYFENGKRVRRTPARDDVPQVATSKRRRVATPARLAVEGLRSRIDSRRAAVSTFWRRWSRGHGQDDR
jgi:small GTP-binding protein